ncbi:MULTISPECIES: multidrug/spermidine efflux SMR transporter subunit MdtI [Pigmentiphaga]|jgi:spermidine export protein MdtI|uniref:Spermidine export protein MdtI n=1 Tax=Pigmentiphaga daeguensis TaxID=414049 RepID=A0ABN1CG66_9BURK|nr:MULTISPECIES: multidrug/spermidine efflux SMR transporter subunit MdtI [unclassified Pigmentiphaga]OVZ61034.1 multidrug transporter subunit MdtI [Pigmentiphaga sp. NML030171]
MLDSFTWFHGAMLLIAAALEVAANIFLKLSRGFTRKRYGALSIALVFGAFACLYVAVQGIELSVAYAAWGALGILATALAGRALFGQHIRPAGWAGMGLLVAGLLLMKFA